MYSFVLGEDEHLDIQWCKNRKDAEDKLESMLFLYEICYDIEKSEYGVITDKEYCKKFDSKYHNSVSVRRLGNKLLERIDEMKNK